MKMKDKTKKQKEKRANWETFIQPATENKQAEDTLQQTEAQYSTLLESIQDGVYAMDTEGHITYVNDAVVMRSERPREWLIGKHFSVLIRPEDRERVQKNFEGRLHGQRIPNYEILYNAPSGKELWVEITTKALHDGDCIVGIIVITHDITEHKRIEKALRESKDRFRSLFEHHNAVLFLFEPVSGAIVDVNEAAARFYGYARAKMREMNINNINRQNPDEIAAEEKQREIEKRDYFIFPHHLASGEVRIVEVHSTPIEAQGKILLFSIVHDITERKQAEEALRNYREHLEELVQERTTNLEMKNKQLMAEITQRKEAEGVWEKLIFELQGALLKIRTLSGLLPICSSCKKIRDDKGYWEQIEVYIRDHSEADFSHSICPECTEKIYPKLHEK
jgi:PAS domain S-box-containing protein